MSVKRRKIRNAWSAKELDSILSSKLIIGFTVWSDGCATVVVGFPRTHIEVNADIWEDFNLQYNIYSYGD